jgi:hypothetical protein
MMFRRILLTLALFAVSVSAAAQSAQPDADPGEVVAPGLAAEQTRAAELKKQGDDAMVDIRYDDAIAAYTESYQLDPRPALLYNLGRSYQARGSYPAALPYLEQFERDAPADLRARVPHLDELIAGVRSKVSTVTITSNVTGATVMIRNREIGKTPLPSSVRVNAGAAKVTVSAPDHQTVSRQVTLAGGQSTSFIINLKALADTTILAVSSPVLGADVYVDGKLIGSVPAEVSVTPGKHTIIVQHADYERVTTTAVIKPGQRKSIDVDLVALPAIYEQWWFWTGLGVIAAGVTVAVVANVTEAPDESGSIAPGTVQAPIISF